MPVTLPIRDEGRRRVRRLTRIFAVAASAGTLGVAGLVAHHAPAKAAADDPPSHRTNPGLAPSVGSGTHESRKAGGSSDSHGSRSHRAQASSGSAGSSGSGLTGSSGQPHATSSGS
jgi:hypothetical protein